MLTYPDSDSFGRVCSSEAACVSFISAGPISSARADAFQRALLPEGIAGLLPAGCEWCRLPGPLSVSRWRQLDKPAVACSSLSHSEP